RRSCTPSTRWSSSCPRDLRCTSPSRPSPRDSSGASSSFTPCGQTGGKPRDDPVSKGGSEPISSSAFRSTVLRRRFCIHRQPPLHRPPPPPDQRVDLRQSGGLHISTPPTTATGDKD